MANSEYSEIQKCSFQECSKRLMALTLKDEEQDLNKVLDQINSYDYNSKIVEDQNGEALLRHCVSLVPLKNEHLVTKFCPMIVHFVRRQEVIPDQETLERLTGYLIRVLRECSPWVLPYTIHALSSLLYQNSSRVEPFWEELAGAQGVLLTLCSPADVTISTEVRFGAIKCIENLLTRDSATKYLTPQQLRNCFDALLGNLQAQRQPGKDDVTYCKMFSSCLSGIQQTLLGMKLFEIPNVGELLACIKFHMFYGLPGQTLSAPQQCLYPSPLSQSYFQAAASTDSLSKAGQDSNEGGNSKTSTRSNKSRKRRPANKKGNDRPENGSKSSSDHQWREGQLQDTCKLGSSPHTTSSWRSQAPSSSESEFSDSEGSNAAKLRSAQSRVRQTALSLLAAVVKGIERKTMFGFWSSFLPDAPASSGTLLSCVLKDPAPKVRSSALLVLTGLLESSKPFLQLAEGRDQARASFTTLSGTLACTVSELQRCLVLALVAEAYPLVLTQVLKCIAALVLNAPAHKMAAGFLAKFVRHLRPLLNHRDSNVRVAVLTAFGAIFAAQPPLEEVANILRRDPSTASSNTPPEEGDGRVKNTPLPALTGQSLPVQPSWMVELCLTNVIGGSSDAKAPKTTPLPVRLESLQVLAAITKDYFSCIVPSIDSVVSVILLASAEDNASVMLHAAKLLEELGRALARGLSLEPQHSEHIPIEKVLSIWTNFLESCVPQLLQNQNHPNLQAKGCDCLSTVAATVFSKLPRHQQILCQTVLLGLTGETDKLVRSTAIRALGVLVLFTNLREDVLFVSDVSERVVSAMQDSNLEVRLKTAWTLANVSDALVLNVDAVDGSFVEEFSDSLLLKLSYAALRATKDNDRVQCNGVRAAGNLLRYMRPKHLENAELLQLVNDCVLAMVNCASVGGNMKVRWNACYALGNMLRNDSWMRLLVPWRSDVLRCLSHLVQNCKNFKVRINAATALCVPAQREAFGSPQELETLWQSLVAGLENIQASMDFIEYQHRDNLVDQIVSALCHLVTLLRRTDLGPSFSAGLLFQIETINEHFNHRLARLVANGGDASAVSVQVLGPLNRLKRACTGDQPALQCLNHLKNAFAVDDEQ